MNLFNRILRRTCTHRRFAWPRTDSSGRYYQVCLDCGVAYEYDWEAMRRTSRVLVQSPQPEALLPQFGDTL